MAETKMAYRKRMLEKRRKGSGTKTKEATEEKRKGAQIKNVNMIAIPINF